MKDAIIIFGSCYGTTKQYAEALSRKTGIEARSYEKAGDLNRYKTIVYMGGLYAGGVQGMKKTLGKLTDTFDKKLLIVTVGLADPTAQDNVDHIRSKMKEQLSKEAFENAHIFHLRGGIDYSRLSLKHKMMMSMVYKKAVKLPEEKKDSEVRAMIETYNKEVSFFDETSLDPIIQDLKYLL